MMKTNKKFIDFYPKLDLHGAEYEYAMFKTKEFIEESYNLKKEKVQIIHGFGNGIVREAVHKTLNKMQTVKNYKIDFYNPGATTIEIKNKEDL